MKLYFRIAWRNLWRHRRRTVIVVFAMGLGLALMMMYDGLIAGFDQAIYGNAIKVLGGNIQVHAQGYRLKANQNPLLPLPDDGKVVQVAQAQPQVQAATRRINTSGLVTSPEGAFGIGITGIEPEAEADINLAAQYVTAGRYLTSTDTDSLFIGRGLAEAMNVQVGDRVTMVGRDVHDQMRQRTMTVIGIYDLGMADIEKMNVYISLGEAQELYGLSGQSTEIAIVLKQLGKEAEVIAAMQPALPDYEVESWDTNYPELKATIATKGAVMNVFSVIILFIAGIGIINMLLMAVYERTREIGLMGALGLKPRQISLLFVIEGTLMGLVGVGAGIVMGLIFNAMMRQVGLDLTSFGAITDYMALIQDKVYPSWGLDNLLGRALTVAIIAAISSLYPAIEASRREPAEALHYV